jgi:2-polyprenyl-6-hydroxyphenyl methylase/3-demethylubiquinone-9 3-methyltransferase
MHPAKLASLDALPPLDRTNRQAASCKICGVQGEFFDVVDFNKCCSEQEPYAFGCAGIPVQYLRCPRCEFVFTTFFDDWTPDEFARFVYNDDYIKVDGEYAGIRPRREADNIAQRLRGLTHLRILDYGSGSGLFADHLRGYGFGQVENYDPFSNPERPHGRFDVITCFEVLEHTPTPRQTLADIADLLDPGGCVLFSTGVQPAEFARLRANWWYVAPRNGHASIFSLRSLAIAGRTAGLTLHAADGAYAFGGPRPSPASRRVLASTGAPIQVFELTSPGRGAELQAGQKTSWNALESFGDMPFRWTKEAEIAWWVQDQMLLPGELVVSIPFRAEVARGFADACRLEVGELSVPLVRANGALTASLTLHESTQPVITLVTPAPLRPCDLRPVKDARFLGLAILN